MVKTSGPTLYWHDYETFGVDPRRDRPAQFAGIRTDLELNIIGEPLSHYCLPSDDFLPQPEACLITGITPQLALAKGVPEAEFIARIHQEFSQPQTCIVGYNNIRFDDEVTRFTLYRNFFDAYAHEWQNGNSRWDIIDMVRLTHALRPEGLQWPQHEDGKPSFRLDQLTLANGIEHGSAHDALSDVKATIAVAKLIKAHQPRLYDFVFSHRSKHKVMELLRFDHTIPVLHVSSMYPVELGCIAPVIPLAMHPKNKNEVLVYDLRVDPEPFLTLDIAMVQQRLFTRTEDLPEGCARLPVKSIHINKCPVIVPVNTLTPEVAEKWKINIQVVQKHQQTILNAQEFIQVLQAAYGDRQFEASHDPDLMLYEGGFFSNSDRERIASVRDTRPELLADLQLPFEDKRLPDMLFRYRARNYPQTLNEEEQQEWWGFRHDRLFGNTDNSGLTINEYQKKIIELRESTELISNGKNILDALEDYGNQITASLEIDRKDKLPKQNISESL